MKSYFHAWSAVAALIIAASTVAQPYPTKAIRFIVPFAPGGLHASSKQGPAQRGAGFPLAGCDRGAGHERVIVGPMRVCGVRSQRVPLPPFDVPRLRDAHVRESGAAAGFHSLAFAAAQEYPTKAIRFIVPFAPGGGTDIIARIIASQLNEALGQAVVVDNRGGAGSTVGTDLTVKAPADGYTILLGNISLAFNASLYKALPYNALTDLAPVTLVAVQPNIVVIHPSVPAKSIDELVAFARAKPGRLAYASAGTGSGTHLAGEMLKMSLKIDLLHIPYKGTGPALTDLIGGQVQMMVSTFASALPHVRSGRLRALGVTSAKRSPAAPDIPTLIEAGVSGYDYSTWYGVLAPAGTPRAIIDKLNRTLRATLAQDDMKQKFDAQGVEPLASTPAQFGSYLKTETEKWTKVVRAAGIPPQ